VTSPIPLRPDSSFDPGTVAPAEPAATRPFYWSVRREIWENRSLWVAPLVVASLVLLASLIGLAALPRKLQQLPAPDAAQLHVEPFRPFDMAPAPIMFASLLVGLFYSLDALYGERRDRSILFWKSLPVSDRTAVLAKACVPLVVLPAIALALSVVTVAALTLLGSAVLLASGTSAAPLWAGQRIVQEPTIMLYGLTVHALWFAPIYAWLLLVSAWARRLPLLWAALPPFALAAVEKVALGTAHVPALLGYRVSGAMTEAFGAEAHDGHVDRVAQLDALRFLGSPGLWLGLAFAAICLAVAVRLRRDREPI